MGVCPKARFCDITTLPLCLIPLVPSLLVWIPHTSPLILGERKERYKRGTNMVASAV